VKRITGRYVWAWILLTIGTSGLHASIEKPVERGQLSIVGAGQLTWWGMTVYDAALAAAFFSIWLDPATREPDLRAQMLGYRQ